MTGEAAQHLAAQRTGGTGNQKARLYLRRSAWGTQGSVDCR
jgi:hypothetical protein